LIERLVTSNSQDVECNVATKKHKQKKASAFKYKASVEEVDEEAKEKEC